MASFHRPLDSPALSLSALPIMQLLVIDDDEQIIGLLTRIIQNAGHTALVAASARAGLDHMKRREVDVVLLDLHLPDQDGLSVLTELRQTAPNVPVILITGDPNSRYVIESMKLGAYDYVQKPFDLASIQNVIRQATEARAQMAHGPAEATAQLAAPEVDGKALVGRSPAMLELFKQIGLAARSDATVLITGESGTGKDLTARAIHQNSRRNGRPYLSINCAALPESLIESELFGHERGSFTGAVQRHPGKFEQANLGTLFLDEVGDMSLPVQAKLLRVLQDGEFQRVGGTEVLRTDTRIIAATNRNLEALIDSGKFRHDLYYRLNVIGLRLPSLRERSSDIEPMVLHFLRKYQSKSASGVEDIEPNAMKALVEFHWPGNVRQLESAVQKAIAFSRTRTLMLSDFAFLFDRESSAWSGSRLSSSGHSTPVATQVATQIEGFGAGRVAETARDALIHIDPDAAAEKALDAWIDDLLLRVVAGDASSSIYDAVMNRVEKRLLSRVHQHYRGNQSETARVLGISRNNLRAKLKEYGVI